MLGCVLAAKLRLPLACFTRVLCIGLLMRRRLHLVLVKVWVRCFAVGDVSIVVLMVWCRLGDRDDMTR